MTNHFSEQLAKVRFIFKTVRTPAT